MSQLVRVKISALGTYVPPRVLTNADLERMVETSDQWIIERTGIRERHIVDKGVATSDLAVEAAKKALAERGIDASDLDAILVGTVTPDMFFPSTACLVQHKLGAKGIWGFDLSAACSAFLYALQTGTQFVATGTHKRVMVIGSDVMSSIIDYTDRATCVIFGDGAGAVLLGPGSVQQGLLAYQLGSDGSGSDLLSRPAGGSRIPPTAETVEQGLHYLTMDGRAIFKWAVRILADSTLAVLNHAECKVSEVRWFIPHQANVRIIHAASDVLGFHRDSVYKNLERYGNTCAGSIPIALDEVQAAGRVYRGDHLLISGFGSGLNWGTALWRW